MYRVYHIFFWSFILLFCSLFSPLLALQSDLVGPGYQEKRAAEMSRASGFGDLEIELLHHSVDRKLRELIGARDIPFEEGTYNDLMKGRDQSGKTFYRFRVREGDSISEDIYPIRYIFRSHVYIYPADGDSGIDRIILQFYRINVTGQVFTRELRRIIHPEPGPGTTMEKVYAGDFTLSANSNIQVELYEKPTTIPPTWEGVDGVPLPELEINPEERVTLNDPNRELAYFRQTTILNLYKELLREVDKILVFRNELNRLTELEKIERLMQFPY